MNWSIALIVLAAGLFAWFALTALNSRVRERRISPAKRTFSPFHAVAIRPRGVGCEMAKALSGRRFLADEAPRLPLDHCDREDCRCMYVHFDDRRRGERRIWATVAPDGGDRRDRGPGRRVADRFGFG
ncbi:MAG TPA: hypothetical protein PLN31_12125 [Azoarcus taiwanensis]|uniref:Uncharacterized protein n=1 Tax=Azoarcus taiwanensis TaxID=666964 RepID=A0A972F612_9RHOO|nr:hypothetical protein [Azoarcus taiwanensis]NMG02096.1 hypothetical protein [Azoarcus taiwanensis]HRQ58158.1 hypothetical protein [Azoarcus taiwanensis]